MSVHSYTHKKCPQKKKKLYTNVISNLYIHIYSIGRIIHKHDQHDRPIRTDVHPFLKTLKKLA